MDASEAILQLYLTATGRTYHLPEEEAHNAIGALGLRKEQYRKTLLR